MRVVLVAWGVALALCWPLPLYLTTRIFGDPAGEADNHFWMFWLRSRSWPQVMTNFPADWPLPLMDPINLLIWWPGGLISPVLGWNLVALFNVWLAGVGGYVLGRQVGGTDRAGWFGLIFLASAPVLWGQLSFGLSEAWPVGYLALHLAGLERARSGQGGGWLACLALVGFLLSGWYNAFFALILDALYVVPLWRARQRGLIGGLLLTGLLVLLPQWVILTDSMALWAGRFPGFPPRTPFAEWRTRPFFGTDLLRYALPTWTNQATTQTTYLGLITIGLVVWGRQRRTLWFALIFLILGLGPFLRVGGEVLHIGTFPVPLLAGWMVRAVPRLAGLTHWHRAALPAVVLLLPAVVVGLERLWARRPAYAMTALILIVIEGTVLTAERWPRRMYRPDPPPELLELPDELPMAQVPFNDGRPGKTSYRPYNQWQVFHGHPVAENYEHLDSALTKSTLLGWLDWQCMRRRGSGAAERPVEAVRDLSPADLERGRQALIDQGFGWIVIHPDLVADRRCTTRAEAVLGPPYRSGERAVVYRLETPLNKPSLQ